MSARQGASAAGRRVRAASVAVAGVALAVTLHVLAGGPHPSAALCMLLAGVLGFGVAPIVARPLSRGRAAALMLGLQVVVHVGLMLATTSTPARLLDIERASGHHSAPDAGAAAASHGMSDEMPWAGVDHSPAAAMVLAHVMASVLLGLLLASADRTMSTLIALLATWVHALRFEAWARARHLVARLCALLDLHQLIRASVAVAPPWQDAADAVRRRGPPSAAPSIT